MQVIALHTRLKANRIEEYERVHAVIPAALDAALRQAGVASWTIWRDGRDLFHRLEVADFDAMELALRDSAANQEWQLIVGPLTEALERTGPLSRVWSLP
ncbi:MAG: rhaM1 [Microbacteriaceae bacterium]|nr:rhaM1 [Microbacteriaceae bacterium]